MTSPNDWTREAICACKDAGLYLYVRAGVGLMKPSPQTNAFIAGFEAGLKEGKKSGMPSATAPSAELEHTPRTDAVTFRRSYGALENLARQLERELAQERDIRSTREITLGLLAESLGVAPEPHQSFDERLLGAASSIPSAIRRSVTDEIAAERHRQREQEGWTEQHDDEHDSGAMAVAAACYALTDKRGIEVQTVNLARLWEWTGWASSWFKPKDQRRNLIRAGALIVAEIERLDRRRADRTEVDRG